MTAPIIAFRTDATAKVALGHLRRCIALATALRGEGAKPAFFCFDDAAARAALAETGFPCEWLPTEVGAAGDVEDTIARMRRARPAFAVVDSYVAGSSYFEALGGAVPALACFDDFGHVDCPVQCVINGLADANTLCYRAPVALLGPRFLVLGPEYWAPVAAKTPDRVGTAMITMGGIDHYDLTTRLIRLLARIDPTIRIHAVVGPYYENVASIEAAAADHGRVTLHRAPPSLQPTMVQSDFAVSAGGFTLYELAAVGVPAVGIALWENQRPNVAALGDRGIVVPLYYHDGAAFDAQLATAIEELMRDPARRRERAQAGQAFIDGQGARRAARAIFAAIGHMMEAT